MFKCLPLLCCFVSVSNNEVFITSPKHATQLIASQHTRTFGKDNLFLEEKNKHDIAEWLTLLDTINRYIKKHDIEAYNTLSGILQACMSLSNHLAETLYNAYTIYKCANLPKEQKVHLIQDFMSNIQSKMPQIDIFKKSVKNVTPQNGMRSPGLKKSLSVLLRKNVQDLPIKDVYQMMYHLVATLEATYDKALKDWAKAAMQAGLIAENEQTVHDQIELHETV